MRLLRHLRVEVVHQHAQRRFGQPALGRELGAAGGANDAGIVEAGGHLLDSRCFGQSDGTALVSRVSFARRKRHAAFARDTRRHPRAKARQSSSTARSVCWIGLAKSAVPRRRVVLAGEIAAHRELHLHGVDAFGGAAVGTGDPAAGEPSVDHVRPRARGAAARHRRLQGEVAALACIGADVEHRQLAGKQARLARTNGVAIIQHHARMPGTQPFDLLAQCAVVRREIKRLAPLDFVRGWRMAVAVERATVEGFRRQEAGRRLPRIERGPGRIAVDVDHRARERGMHGGGAELGCKGVKLVDVPIGVVARQRKRHQGCGALGRNAHAGVGKRQQQWRIALRHGEPRLAHVFGPSMPGRSRSAAAASAPARTRSAAAAISGAR